MGSDVLHTLVMTFADYYRQGCGSSTLHLPERVAFTDVHGVMAGRWDACMEPCGMLAGFYVSTRTRSGVSSSSDVTAMVALVLGKRL